MKISSGSGRAGEASPSTATALSRILVAAALAVGAHAALPGAAGAVVYCVPAFHAECVDDGFAVAEPSLATALSTGTSDGGTDAIFLAPGTYVSPGTWDLGGTDHLFIYGSGRGQTVLTSSATDDRFVVNGHLGGYRYINVQDLDIAIPASFPDSGGLGGGLRLGQDTHVTRVDIINYNDAPSTAIEWHGSASFIDGQIRSETAEGIGPVLMGDGTHFARLENVVLNNASGYAVVVDAPSSNPSISNVDINRPGLSALLVLRGNVRLNNAVIPFEGTEAPLAVLANSSSDASLNADHVTIVKTGGDVNAAGSAFVAANQTGYADLVIRSSILHGFSLAFVRQAPVDELSGDANARLSGSNGPTTFWESGDGNAAIVNSIDVDPQFVSATNFRLKPGSPSIDAVDSEIIVWDDRDGVLRPQDGDRNGVPRSDQGAFERDMPPPTIKITSGPGKKVKKVKKGKKGVAVFKFKVSETQGRVECRINVPGAKWKACKSGVKFKLKPRKKKYKFQMRMWNLVGKQATKPPFKRFNVTQAKKKKK